MDIKTANTIVNEYGAILATMNYFVLSELQLPYNKNDVKNAIRIILAYLLTEKVIDWEMISTCMGGYCSLANFIEDKSATKFQKLFKTFESTLKVSKSLNEDETTEWFKKKISDILDENKKLQEDIFGYISHFESGKNYVNDLRKICLHPKIPERIYAVLKPAKK